MVTFHMTMPMNELNKYCHGRWKSSSIGQTPTCFLLATRDEMLSWIIEVIEAR